MNVMDGNKMVVFGGQGDNQQLAKAALWQGTLTGDVLEWANLTLQGSGSGSTAASAALTLPSTRTGHAAAHDAETGMLHVFGGAKNKRFFKDIHTYDAANNKWQAIASEGGVAPACSYHSMNFYRGELFIFGGVIPQPDPTPDTCSNTLLIFNFAQKNWYRPSISGSVPCARNGHSATLIEDSLLIFGGWDIPAVFADCFVLDITLLEFTNVTATGPSPSMRSWHAAVALPVNGRRLVLIHGGYDGDKALGDSYVLDMDNNKWTDVSAQIKLSPRAGHTAITVEQGGALSIVFFGGGDNEEGFFNDVFVVRYDDGLGELLA